MMWGLILKDLYTLSRYGKFLLIYLLAFGAIFMSQGNTEFLSSMVQVMITVLAISTFSYDDYAKWDKYVLSTPMTRKKVVLAKYILVLLMVAVGAILGLAINLVGKTLNPEADLVMGMAALGASSLVGATMTGLIIPFIYKFGTEKSRLIMMLVFAVPTLLLLGIAKILPPGALDGLEKALPALLISVPLFCIAVICFSYVISVKIYSKKEIQ